MASVGGVSGRGSVSLLEAPVQSGPPSLCWIPGFPLHTQARQNPRKISPSSNLSSFTCSKLAVQSTFLKTARAGRKKVLNVAPGQFLPLLLSIYSFLSTYISDFLLYHCYLHGIFPPGIFSHLLEVYSLTVTSMLV